MNKRQLKNMQNFFDAIKLVQEKYNRAPNRTKIGDTVTITAQVIGIGADFLRIEMANGERIEVTRKNCKKQNRHEYKQVVTRSYLVPVQ